MHADSSHFPSKYHQLNKNQLPIHINRLHLARCVMMVGCGGWGAFAKRGILRLINLGTLALCNTIDSRNGLTLDPSFKRLDMSEQIPTSYYIGMGIAKAFSEQHLSTPWLSHISSFKNQIIWNGPIKQGKISLYQPPKGKKAKEPDLIGYDLNGKPHILESKGYSSGFRGDILQHAINQVSQVSTVSNVRPETRVAIFSDLSKHPFQARIVDPDGPEIGGCSIEWGLLSCILDYYSVFLRNSENLNEFQINNQKYVGFALISPNLYIGLNTRIFEHLSRIDDLDIDTFLRLAVEIKESSGNSENYSIGIDGIALVDQG